MLLGVPRSRAVAAGVALLVVLLLASASSPAQAAVPGEETQFCRSHELQDYAAPFERMPKLHQPSPTGKVGFGPESLRLWSAPSLVFGAGEVGFALDLAYSRATGLSLPWSVKASLVEVNGNGRPTGKPRRLVERVGSLNPSRADIFGFAVSEKPAFYRATIAFHGASGKKLGELSSYHRVMRADQEARLRVNAAAYRLGTSVVGRVENFGSVPITYGAGYRIERLEGSTWRLAPESPRGPVIAIAYVTSPGRTGSGSTCLYFPVPDSTPPGRYRMVIEASLPSWDMRNPAERTLTAEFDVVP
ncbi:MAG TPA: immunoglobulin-like domain-containing protein [Solirubrobacterales bacterium]|nr:immunoglobulin-like domain-containing protein [Solirubrobacterales bacterium]